MSQCIHCGKELEPDEIGVHKKLVNRGATEFMCKQCLAKKFRCDVALIDEKIRQFKEMGCTLFA